MSSPEITNSFRVQEAEAGVHLYLNGVQGDVSELLGARVCGMPLMLSIVPVTDWIDPTDLANAAVAVVQVDADSPASIKRFERLRAAENRPLIAACYEPPLTLVRALLKAGAHDVLPLPLTIDELEVSVAPLLREAQVADAVAPVRTGRLVSFIKAGGGVGATAVATQLACRVARREREEGRETALVDLDVQFGDAAFQLGLGTKLSVADLLDAGARLDGQLLRATTVQHPSGLHVVAAPAQTMPLETFGSEQVLSIVERAQREFGTVFVDLPANWTNWSLSLVARSDLVLLLTELSVAGLHRARRQLDLLAEQGLSGLDLRVVVNRFDKRLFRAIRQADAEETLGRPIGFTVADEPDVVGPAIDRGVPVEEIKRRSAFGRDLDVIGAALAAAMGREG